MNIQRIYEQHLENYPCKDEKVITYRRQHMRIMEDYENRKHELKGANEIAIDVANKIQKLLE